MQSFNNIVEKLNKINNQGKEQYQGFIPTVWSNTNALEQNKIIKVDLVDFFLSQFKKIEQTKVTTVQQNTNNLVIYNLFVRLGTAFDHNQDGKIANEKGKFKETGTFLKTIALLPYLKELGVNVLYMLPITAIGQDGKKGDLGSPYSTRNPYKLDENLYEPLLNGDADELDIYIDEQFHALVEAAHHIGIKVVNEFIFRTASKDSSIAVEHPDWFYWIKNEIPDRKNNANQKNNTSESNTSKDDLAEKNDLAKYYGNPIFTEEELIEIRKKVESGDLKDLPEPSIQYKAMFSEPPEKVNLVDGKLVGILANGEKVRIPSAFADWPPDDIQPAWSDVTYLKLYDNPDFNYIAYNTVRMYDEELIQTKYEAVNLWKYIENIIPYYQIEFGIDGVMIDMGHALPKKLLRNIIEKARNNNPDFLFWEENFVPNQNSVNEGFNLVLGYLPFDQHSCEKMKTFIRTLESCYFPLQCFATPETHDTPRAAFREGGTKFSKIAYITNKLLPIPTFIHSGFELGEVNPMNTGLGFEAIDTKNYTDDKLTLFSTASLNWNIDSTVISLIFETDRILSNKLNDFVDFKVPKSVELFECDNKNILVFTRNTIDANIKYLLIANYSSKEEDFEIKLIANHLSEEEEKSSEEIKLEPPKTFAFVLGENNFTVEDNNTLHCKLSSFEFLLLEVRE